MNDFLYNSGVRIIMRYAICDCGKLEPNRIRKPERKPHFCRRAGTICDIIDSMQIEERGML